MGDWINVSIPYSSGLWFSQVGIFCDRLRFDTVSIPYSSGLWFSRRYYGAVNYGEAVFQSRIHPVSDFHNEGLAGPRWRPQMFQSRIHPVSDFHLRFPPRNLRENSECFNPVFIRSLIFTYARRTYSDSEWESVSIPYSSGLWFSPR